MCITSEVEATYCFLGIVEISKRW